MNNVCAIEYVFYAYKNTYLYCPAGAVVIKYAQIFGESLSTGGGLFSLYGHTKEKT